MAPDKIYVTPAFISNHELDKHDYEQDVEYIRKDALLEWAKEKYLEYNKSAEDWKQRKDFQEVIDKLNSM